MAGDTNSNIFINIDTSQAMAQLRALEKELTALNRALVTGTKTAAAAQSKYAQGLLHNVNATGQWTASMTRMRTATEQFSTALDRSKLSLKEYFRYGMASTRTFGRFFGDEFGTVSKLVEKRVKILQQQYVQLGRDAQGAMNALKFTPKALNYKDVTTQLMMATQRQQIFNKLLDDGATKLLNFGKNTQWAGRQLMVGFTIPLMLFGTQAIRTFKEIETQMIRFRKVYGDIFTDPGQTEVALKNIRALADEYTKYGVKVSDTIKMAADAAAAGNTGKDLENIVQQTNKLAVLGGVTQEKALETTIALKNAFKIGTEDLDQTINFLNAVENQTVVALEDLTEAIPRVAPVVQQLGGDVKDLAFFMAAMQEGGISAAQGANALKSGLGSLINPSNKAAEAALKLGININGIVEANQGNLRNIVVGFAQSLEPLTDLQRTRIIEDVFGKFQFARISALLNNITKEGTQAARVLQLANASVEELAILSERELGVQADSAMNKFVGAVERLKAAIAPVGEIFAKTLTPAIEFITRMAERFNKLPEGIKKGIAVITAVVGGLGPIFLMTFGLLANALANTMKGFNLLRKGYQSLAYGSSDAALKTQYLTNEELENISVTNSLYSSHERLSAAYRLESTALTSLIAQYGSATSAMRNFSASNPGLFVPGRAVPPIRRAGGGKVSGPGTSTSDSIPAYLSDGEYVVNSKAVDTYGVETFDALNARKFAGGGIAMKNGIPRLFTGGWMQRVMQSMMPRTRLGVVQDGLAISGFRDMIGPSAGLSRNPLVIKDLGDKDHRVKVYLKNNEKDFFYIKKSAKPSLERGIGTYLDKNKDKSTEKIYEEMLRQIIRPKSRFSGASIKGREIQPSDLLNSLPKYRSSPSTSKSAPPPVARAFRQAAEANPRSLAGKLKAEFDNEISFLKDTTALTVNQKRKISKYLTTDVSHLDPSDAFLWTTRTGSRDLGVINKAISYERKKFAGGTHITTDAQARAFLQHLLTQKALRENTKSPLPATSEAAILLLARRLDNGFYTRHNITDKGLGLNYPSYRTDPVTKKHSLVNEFAMGGRVKKYANGVFSVPGPKGAGDVVPAMLSPGESVIPTAQTQKYMPLIKSIVADNVPGYAGSNIDDPWDTPSNVPLSRSDMLADRMANKVAEATTRGGLVGRIARGVTGAIDKAVNSGPAPMTSRERVASTRPVPPTVAQPFMALTNAVNANTASVQDDTDATKTNATNTKAAQEEAKRLKRQQGIRGYMTGYSRVPTFDPENPNRPLTSAERTNYRQFRRQQIAGGAMGLGMAAGAAGSVAMMYGMAKPESFAGQNMGLIMGVTALAGVLPLLNSPLKMLAASVLGLIVLFKMQSAQIKQALLDGEKQAQAMSMTTNKLELLGQYTDEVSKTQLAAAQRATRTTEITPVNQTFGVNFLGSEQGKAMKQQFDETVKAMGTEVAARNFASQLASAVQQGVLTSDQAESIATSLARSLNDTMLEANLRGRLIELVGPNGINLSKNPYELNVKLMVDARDLEKISLQMLKTAGANLNQPGLGFKARAGLDEQGNLIPGGPIFGNPMNWSEGAQLTGGAIAGTTAVAYKGAKLKQAIDAVKAARAASAAATAVTGAATAGTAGAAAPALIASAISFGVTTVIASGAEIALRQWQKGQEKKSIAKIAGRVSGIITQNLALSQQSIDAMNAEYNSAIENLNMRKKIAKTAKERARLEQQITDLEKDRDEALANARKQQAEQIKDAANYLDQIQSKEARKKYADAFSEQFKNKFKDDPFLKARASALTDTMTQKGISDKAKIEIQALVTSDQLTLGQAEALVTTLTAPGAKLRRQMDLIIRTTGLEGLARFAEISQYLDKKRKGQFQKIVDERLLRGQTKSVNDLYSALEEIIKIPDFVGIDINVEIDEGADVPVLEKLGKDANQLKRQFTGKPITLTALTEYQNKLNGVNVTNDVLDTAIKNWKLLESLDPNVRLQAMMTLSTLTVSDDVAKDIKAEQLAGFKKTDRFKSLQASMKNMPSNVAMDLMDKELSAFQRSAAGQKIATDYINDLMARIFPPAKSDNINPPVKTGEDQGKAGMDLSWLSDLLQKLKLFKESTIDATGNWTQLMGQIQKYFGPQLFKNNPMLGALDKQRSAIEQIQKASASAGITLSSAFLDFLKGLDAEAFEDIVGKLFNINKEGEYSLKLFPAIAEQLKKLPVEDRERFVGPTDTLAGALNEAFKGRTLVDFIEQQRISLKETDNQTKAFEKLTSGVLGFTMSAEQAAKYVEMNKDLAADIASGAKVFTEDEIKGITKSLKEYNEILAKNTITKLQPSKQVLDEQNKALQALIAENIDYEVALRLIEDQALAAYIAANPKSIRAEMKNLVDETANLVDLMKALEKTKFFAERTNAINLKKDFAEIAPILAGMGISLEDISSILSNPTLAKAFIQDLQDGKLDAEQLKKYLDQIPEEKTFDLKIKLSTREGQEQAFDDLYNKAMEYFGILEEQVQDRYEPIIKAAEKDAENAQKAIDATNKIIDGYELDIQTKQRNIEEKISRPIEILQEDINDLNKILQDTIERPVELLNRTAERLQRRDEIEFGRVIEGYQRDIELLQRAMEISFDRPIGALQEESSDLSNDLTLMDEQVGKINDKYDLQEKALKQISDVNQEIANQQKQQITLADALSQGDISAAAQAAQEMRDAAAASRTQNQSELLAEARRLEIDNLRTKSGLTRKQIEERQFAIGQQIYQLEEQRESTQAQILIIEDKIYQKEQDRLPLQTELRDIQDRIYNLELQRVPLQDKIYLKEQEIYNLEELREAQMLIIRGIEDTIYNIKVGQLKIDQDRLTKANETIKAQQDLMNAELEAIDVQRERWRDAKLAIETAKIENGLYNDVIEISNDLVSLLADGWYGVADAILAAVSALALYNTAQQNKLTSAQVVENARDVGIENVGYTLDSFNNLLSDADAKIVALELAIAEAADKGLSTEQLEAELKAATDAAAKLAQQASDTADALDAIENATSEKEIADLMNAATQIASDPDLLYAIAAKGNGVRSGYSVNEAIEAVQSGLIPSDMDPKLVAMARERIKRGASVTGGGGGQGDLYASGGGLVPKYMSRGGMIKAIYRPMGGLIPYMANGGIFKSRGTDTVPAMLTPGEFVMSRYAVENYGLDKMKAINNGDYENEAVYNYSVNVNVKSGANPDEIARAVMTQIKQVDSQRVRGQRAV